MRVFHLSQRSSLGLVGLFLAVALGCGQADESAEQPDRDDDVAVSEDLAEPLETDNTDPGETAPGETTHPDEIELTAEPGVMELNPAELAEPNDASKTFVPELSPFPKLAKSPALAESPRHTNSREASSGGGSPVRVPKATAVPRSSAADVEPAGQSPASSVSKRDEQTETTQDNSPYDLVTLFYATDRKRIGAAAIGWGWESWALAASVGAMLILVLVTFRTRGIFKKLTFGMALSALLGLLFVVGLWGKQWLDPVPPVAEPMVHYGNHRGELDLGTCQVSIPWSHRLGEVETPSILRLEVREDVRKHVVLQTVDPQPEDVFFEQLHNHVQSAERPEVFVFVHGYNVTFDKAARRTAQIAYDVKFRGAPIFFSWPSQGGVLKYTVDETNVTWAVPHLKKFLLDVVRRSGATSVSLIAHSMGNRAMTSAVRELQLELRDESALFNQIILAAPDLDAEIFRRDLAPALAQSAQRVTLYASSNDQALVASRQVHGYARAGDTGDGLVVVSGIDTIDVSNIATSLLGHSYYGSSNPVLADINELIRESRPANQRQWLEPRPLGGLTYWVLQKIKETAARP